MARLAPTAHRKIQVITGACKCLWRAQWIRTSILRWRVALQQAGLAHHKCKRNGGAAEGFEVDPEAFSLRAPDHLVQNGHKDKEIGPATGKDYPAFIVHRQHLTHQVFQVRPPTDQPPAQDACKDKVHDGWLHLDEGRIVQPDRQTAKDHHDNRRNDRHLRQVAGQNPRNAQADQNGRDEDDRRQHHALIVGPKDIDGVFRVGAVGDEKDRDGAKLQHEFQDRVYGAHRHGWDVARLGVWGKVVRNRRRQILQTTCRR